MNLKQAVESFIGGDDERAVSPVIGVILMVAITVILAAVIGTFVLGLGDRISQAQPNAQFDFDYTETSGNNDKVEIAHDGGDGVESNQLTVTIGGDDAWDSGSFVGDFTAGSSWSGKLTAGSSLTIKEASVDSITDGETVKIIWSADGSDKTAVIGEGEVSF